MVELTINPNQSKPPPGVEGTIAQGTRNQIEPKDLLTIQQEMHQVLFPPSNTKLYIPSVIARKMTPADASKFVDILKTQRGLLKSDISTFLFNLSSSNSKLSKTDLEMHFAKLPQAKKEKIALQLKTISNKLAPSKAQNAEKNFHLDLGNSLYSILIMLATVMNKVMTAADKARIQMADSVAEDTIDAAKKRLTGAEDAFGTAVAGSAMGIAGGMAGGKMAGKAPEDELNQLNATKPVQPQDEAPIAPGAKPATDSSFTLTSEANPIGEGLTTSKGVDDPLSKEHQQFSTGENAHNPAAREQYDNNIKAKLNDAAEVRNKKQRAMDVSRAKLPGVKSREKPMLEEGETVFAPNGEITPKGREVMQSRGYSDEDMAKIEEHTVYSAKKESSESTDQGKIKNNYETWEKKHTNALQAYNNHAQKQNVRAQSMQGIVSSSSGIVTQSGDLAKAEKEKEAATEQATAGRQSALEQAMQSQKNTAQANIDATLQTASQIMAAFFQAHQSMNIV